MDKDYPKLFGDAIRRRREYLGMTKAELADMLNASEYLISAIESGEVGIPAYPYLVRIAEVFDSDIVIALEGKNPEFIPGNSVSFLDDMRHAWNDRCSCTRFGRFLRKVLRRR